MFFKVVNPVWGHGRITQTEISIVHTIFNIATTVMLFPVSNLIIKLAKKISGVKDDERDDSVVSLDDRMLQTPSLALQATVGEVARMGEIVNDTLDDGKTCFFLH